MNLESFDKEAGFSKPWKDSPSNNSFPSYTYHSAQNDLIHEFLAPLKKILLENLIFLSVLQ